MSVRIMDPAAKVLADFRAEIHDGADHGFGVIGSGAYHQSAADRSYERVKVMFDRELA